VGERDDIRGEKGPFIRILRSLLLQLNVHQKEKRHGVINDRGENGVPREGDKGEGMRRVWLLERAAGLRFFYGGKMQRRPESSYRDQEFPGRGGEDTIGEGKGEGGCLEERGVKKGKGTPNQGGGTIRRLFWTGGKKRQDGCPERNSETEAARKKPKS